ncbi:hypothetical protein PanWU01x14_229020 [Parasponia andersonii]|uniref:Uncharacterized protein n=1 Tax=Parasponia andersonii TaxID=3476 RepID=A0A2P5BLC2_PARAD|nr:hypothetical protein PanWU01x14_229020 [Parasponia andersonii]
MLPKYYAPTLSRILVVLQNKGLLTVEGCVPHRVLKTDSLPPPECLRILQASVSQDTTTKSSR